MHRDSYDLMDRRPSQCYSPTPYPSSSVIGKSFDCVLLSTATRPGLALVRKVLWRRFCYCAVYPQQWQQ
jgi:hypothetical protein